MSDVDLIIRELEWRRLRQRLVSNPFRAMLLTIATWTIVAVLKPVAR